MMTIRNYNALYDNNLINSESFNGYFTCLLKRLIEKFITQDSDAIWRKASLAWIVNHIFKMLEQQANNRAIKSICF